MMNKFLKKIGFKMAIALVATLGFAGITSADTCSTGGNQCGLNPDYLEAGGGSWSVGGYEAIGGAINVGTGEVLDRLSLSESGGSTNTNGSFNANTCGGECSDFFAQAGGEGTAFQKSYTGITTNGTEAQSTAAGAAGVDLNSGSFAYKLSNSPIALP